jgi:hypothetical protein
MRITCPSHLILINYDPCHEDVWGSEGVGSIPSRRNHLSLFYSVQIGYEATGLVCQYVPWPL